MADPVEKKHTGLINQFHSSHWKQFFFYARYMVRSALRNHPDPLILGIAITDRCNLACLGCHVSNTGRRDMTWGELLAAMQNAWERGFRELYFTGGEPMLWRDATHTLSDVIAAAKQIGFFHVHVYTNGLLGLDSPADLMWVSMDGLPGVFDLRRGDHFHQVEAIIRAAQHPKIAVNYVIDRNTAKGIEPFLRWVRDTHFPVLGVMFYFHTPYYGHDELFLSAEERKPIIDQLLTYIHDGLPVINSRAGLLALRSGNWQRRSPIAAVVDVDGEFVCCRAADEVCPDCGYGACTELTEILRLRPTTILGMTRYL
jgi:MoaA/NifB/PqqE/SkfB family radical SAM enzyme